MRNVAIASVFLVFFNFAYAENIPNGLTKSLCQPGTQVKESGAIFSAEGGKGEYTKLLSTTNFCTDEKVTLGGFLGNILRDEITCICRNQQEFAKVGCDRADQRQPVVTTIIARSKSGCVADSITISKCVTDPAAAYQAACKMGRNMARVTPVDSNAPLVTGSIPSTPQTAPTPIMPINPATGQPQMPFTVTGGQTYGSSYQVSTPIGGSSYPPSIGYPGYPGSYEYPSYHQPYPSFQSYQSMPQAGNFSVYGQPHNFQQSVQYQPSQQPNAYQAPTQQSANAIFPPASLIIAQPAAVRRGDTIVLSWVSVGMNANAQCQIFVNGSILLGQANEGTRAVSTTLANDMQSAMTFVQLCRTQTGIDIERSASVTLN